MKRASKQPRKLSESLHRQLNAYALAASTAGVSMLALAKPAEAKIVYTPAHEKITNFHLDLNHDGVTDFLLQTTSRFSMATAIFALYVSPLYEQNEVWREVNYATALPAGVRIGAGFPRGGRIMIHNTYTIINLSTKFHGPWANSGKGIRDRYLGLKFLISGKTHFGWARFNIVPGHSGYMTCTLTGYAYETIPSKPIIAGKTKGPDDGEPTALFNTHTPEPVTLAKLALGAPTLAIWRREESVVAASKPN